MWALFLRTGISSIANGAQGCESQLSTATKEDLPPPAATYTATVGQDEAVTAGRLHGAVLKFDVFYPMPVKFTNYRFLYLFGTTALQVKRAHSDTPLILQPASSTVNGYDPSVTIISSPSDRDTYGIGVGLDAVGVLCTIFSSKSAKIPATRFVS